MARASRRGSGPSRGTNETGIRRRQAASTVLSVRHAIEILRNFSSEAPLLGITDIASRVGLHKSSVSRLVATLEEDDLVERDPSTRRIRLGRGLLSLTAPLLESVRFVDATLPQLSELAQRSGETISLSVWDGSGAVNLKQVLGGKAVKHYATPGSRNPAHATAAGKLLLAFAPDEIIERTLARNLIRFTPRTLCSRTGILAEIATIRRQGYALNEGELALDVGAVAAPARNDKGAVVAAITATVPMYRFTATNRKQLIEFVQDTADTISTRLGFSKNDRLRYY
jgi:DNA-binding IclR family transcriptional regulator